jgi:hypothetical protein
VKSENAQWLKLEVTVQQIYRNEPTSLCEEELFRIVSSMSCATYAHHTFKHLVATTELELKSIIQAAIEFVVLCCIVQIRFRFCFMDYFVEITHL